MASIHELFLSKSSIPMENTCVWSLFLNKVADLRHGTLLKKRLWRRCFPVNFSKFLWTLFFLEHLIWLLLIHLWLKSANLPLSDLRRKSWKQTGNRSWGSPIYVKFFTAEQLSHCFFKLYLKTRNLKKIINIISLVKWIPQAQLRTILNGTASLTQFIHSSGHF